MGIFKLFGSDVSKKTTSKSARSRIEELDKILENSDKAIAECQKADEEYSKDGDIGKRISVYEKHFLQRPQWNCFNFCWSLAEMYMKAGENDKAWGYVNQLYLWTTDPKCNIHGYNDKVRYIQFKLLKSEKRFKEALVMLVSSYMLNAYAIQGIYFNKKKFIKEAKTTAKGIGFSEDDLNIFADKLENDLKKKRLTERNVKTYCNSFYSSLNL